jgi:hypothetical protein
MTWKFTYFSNVCHHESFQGPNVSVARLSVMLLSLIEKGNNGFGVSSDSHLVILLLCHRMKRGMWTDWIGVDNERHVVLCDAVISWVHAVPNCRLQISNITMTNALEFRFLVKILWCLISRSVFQSRSVKHEFWSYLIFLRNLISLIQYNFSEF